MRLDDFGGTWRLLGGLGDLKVGLDDFGGTWWDLVTLGGLGDFGGTWGLKSGTWGLESGT